MRPLASLAALACLLAAGSAQQEVYRRAKTPFDAVSLNAGQRKKVDAITARYTPRLTALNKVGEAGKDVSDPRDALNREYSKALLAVMTPPQKTAYMEAVYRHMQDFLATHKDRTVDEIFIWGGAYAKRPATHG